MSHRKIYDRFGNEFEISNDRDDESHIIPNEKLNRADTTLDDNIDAWHQLY